MYCFHESDPLSRPSPVSLLPPKAPPISAPFVGMLTFTIPQSEPLGPVHWKTLLMDPVNKELESPCFTLLLILMASSMVLNLNVCRI